MCNTERGIERADLQWPERMSLHGISSDWFWAAGVARMTAGHPGWECISVASHLDFHAGNTVLTWTLSPVMKITGCSPTCTYVCIWKKCTSSKKSYPAVKYWNMSKEAIIDNSIFIHDSHETPHQFVKDTNLLFTHNRLQVYPTAGNGQHAGLFQ